MIGRGSRRFAIQLVKICAIYGSLDPCHPRDPWLSPLLPLRVYSCPFVVVSEKIVRILLEPGGANQNKLVDVQPAKAVIVNSQEPNAPIEIGFVTL